jgi:hypothetical protein
METAILRLAEHRPPGLTDAQWAYCIQHTWNLHCNYGGLYYMPTDALLRFTAEFNERIDRGPDGHTIDWYWGEYMRLAPRARNYTHYRPTANENRADFERGIGESLAWWRSEYERRTSGN